MIGYAAHLAAEAILPRAELSTVGMELRFHAAAGLLVLLVPAVLSVYKPRGLTSYGRRKQQEQKGQSQQPDISRPRPSAIHQAGANVSSGGSITVTLRRMQIIGLAVSVLVVHFIILHLAGPGSISH